MASIREKKIYVFLAFDLSSFEKKKVFQKKNKKFLKYCIEK
jgi:hypothetical protein